MTVSSTTASAKYTGNGTTQIFTVPFYFLVDTDVKISKKTGSTGVVSVLTLGTDYTLSGAGSTSGGSATLVTAPAGGTTPDTIYIERNVSEVQETSYPEGGPFPSASHEKAMDRLTMISQQLSTAIALALGKGALDNYYDVGGNLLSNMADGVAATDATTLGQVQQLVAGAAGGIVPSDVALYSALAALSGGSLVGYTDTDGITGMSDILGAVQTLAQRAIQNGVEKVIRSINDGSTVKIVCLGDSLTYGYKPDTTQATTPYPARLQALLQQYYANANVTCVNKGIPGNTSAQMIARFNTDVTAENPDLIILNAGTNDAIQSNSIDLAQYRLNILKLLLLCGSTPVVMLGLPPRFKDQGTANGESVIHYYRETFKQVAYAMGHPYIDTFSAWMDIYKNRGYARGTLSTDGEHYTDQGYLLFGDMIFTKGFANDDLAAQPGQFKDMGGQWVVTDATKTSWGGTDNIDGNTLVLAANAAIRLYVYVEKWQNCALVLHATIDNTAATAQTVSVENRSVASPVSRSFSLSQKANGGATSGYLNGYPIVTVKLKPGLNNILVTAGADGARLCGLSILPTGDSAYEGVLTNSSYEGSGNTFFGASLYQRSTHEYKTLRPPGTLTISNGGSYVEPYFELIPREDTAVSRWRFRATIPPSTNFFFGQQQSTTLGTAYAYALQFDGTNAIVKVQTHDGTIQTAATVALAIASTGAEIVVDITSTQNSWSLWVNGTLIYSDTVPLSAGWVFAQNSNASYRVYLNPPLMKGINATDSGVLIGERWISYTDGKEHLINAAGTNVSVTYA